VNNRFRASHFVYNSWRHRRRRDDGRDQFTTAVVWWQVEQEALLIVAHIFYLKPDYLPMQRLVEDTNAATEWAMRTSDITMGLSCLVSEIGLWPRDGTADDRSTAVPTIAHLAIKRASNNSSYAYLDLNLFRSLLLRNTISFYYRASAYWSAILI